MPVPSCASGAVSACDLSQPIERIDIQGLTVADWTNVGAVNNAIRYIDVPLSQTYEVQNSILNNGKWHEEPAFAPSTVASQSGQGTGLEFINPDGTPATTTSNLVRFYAYGVQAFRPSIRFDVESNSNWFIGHLSALITPGAVNTHGSHTFNLPPINNINAATSVASVTGRLGRATDLSAFYINNNQIGGTNAAPTLTVDYLKLGGTAASQIRLLIQFIAFEG